MKFRIERDERSFRRLIARLVGSGEHKPWALSQAWYLPEGVDGAADEMEYSAQFGRLRGSPVYHVEVRLGAESERRQLLRVAMLVLGALGLVHHEAVILGRGTELHLVINRVDPHTGAVWFGVSDRQRLAAALRLEAMALGWPVDQPGGGADRELRATRSRSPGWRHRRK